MAPPTYRSARLMLAGDRLGFFVRPVSTIHPRSCILASAVRAAFSPVLVALTAFSNRWTYPFVRKISSPSNAGWRFV
jgi:hypothetical protein